MGIRKIIKKKIEERAVLKKYSKFITNKVVKQNWDNVYINRIALINAAVTNILKKKKNAYILK
jgi:hypothetical protein